jgi:hypothetical protein
VIAAVGVTAAGFSLFLDVRDFATRGHLAIPTDDAPTCESGEAEKPNETHDALHGCAEQFACRAHSRDPHTIDLK